ncbi:helix-turn-helix domain-containing protein [Rhodococcus erythropolis]
MKSGRTVAEVAAALDVTEQTIYNWPGPRAHRHWAKAGAELDRER